MEGKTGCQVTKRMVSTSDERGRSVRLPFSTEFLEGFDLFLCSYDICLSILY